MYNNTSEKEEEKPDNNDGNNILPQIYTPIGSPSHLSIKHETHRRLG